MKDAAMADAIFGEWMILSGRQNGIEKLQNAFRIISKFKILKKRITRFVEHRKHF